MPWGWRTTKRQSAHTGTVVEKPVRIVTPWGWPGYRPRVVNPIPELGVMGQQASDSDASNVLPFESPKREKVRLQEERRFEIAGSQFGGFHLVAVANCRLREARSPWGW